MRPLLATHSTRAPSQRKAWNAPATFCPSGTSGISPTMTIMLQFITALSMGFACHVAHAMSKPATCGGCGFELSCSKTLIQIVRVRVVIVWRCRFPAAARLLCGPGACNTLGRWYPPRRHDCYCCARLARFASSLMALFGIKAICIAGLVGSSKLFWRAHQACNKSNRCIIPSLTPPI